MQMFDVINELRLIRAQHASFFALGTLSQLIEMERFVRSTVMVFEILSEFSALIRLTFTWLNALILQRARSSPGAAGDGVGSCSRPCAAANEKKKKLERGTLNKLMQNCEILK